MAQRVLGDASSAEGVTTNRPHRCRVGLSNARLPATQAMRPVLATCPAQDSRRALLRRLYRLWVAAAAVRVLALADGLLLVPPLVPGRHLGAATCRAPRAAPRQGRPGPAAERLHPGQPVRHEPKRWRGAGLRWRQAAQQAQGPSAGRHAGPGAQGQGPRRRHPESCRGAPAARRNPRAVPAPADWGVEVVQHPSVPRWDLVPTPDPASRSGVRIEYRRLPHTETERGFRDVLPRPCVVQWTCSWPGQGRRLSKDYGRLCETGEALIYTTMGRPMVRRLAHG